MTKSPSFDSLIAGPLTAAVGETLLAVDYWILDCDKPTFQAERPNASGVAAIGLTFRGTTLDVTWGWEKAFRTGGEAYHIQAVILDHHGRGGRGRFVRQLQGLFRVTGSQAEPWNGVMGTPLNGAEVYGPPDSPQAIRLSFPTGSIVMTTGDPGEDPGIGDGDEMLIFREAQWRDQGKRAEWTLLWATSAGARQVLAAR